MVVARDAVPYPALRCCCKGVTPLATNMRTIANLTTISPKVEVFCIHTDWMSANLAIFTEKPLDVRQSSEL